MLKYLKRSILISLTSLDSQKKQDGLMSGQKHDWASQMALVVKNLPANSGDIRDAGSSIPGSGRSLGGRQPTPVFLAGESHGQRSLVGHSPQLKSQTQLKWVNIHTEAWLDRQICYTDSVWKMLMVDLSDNIQIFTVKFFQLYYTVNNFHKKSQTLLIF